jgi:beta-glucanase (GH16 family)
MLRRTRALTIIGVTAAAVMTASILPILAADDVLTLRPVADTTVSQVPQDGDNTTKTTLASCPALCDGNPRGRRDATLQFLVDKLPANAVKVKATLRVHAWHDAAARILARTVPDEQGVQAIDRVTKGFNEFDVSGSVRANGTYTFALSQEAPNTRVYWASLENTKTDLRPELRLTYEIGTQPSAPSTTLPPPTTAPAPSAKPTARPPTTVPTTSPPATTKPPAQAPPDDWKLIWSDDFNGGTIDRTKWNLRNNEGRDVDLGCNTNSPKNSFVGGGNLTIRALRETAVCSSQTRQYTQGYLDTIGKHSWTYGKFEMRAKSPNKPDSSKGLWPAFWLRPEDGGNGEIDVTELPGGKDLHARSTAGIFYDYSPVKQDARLALPAGGYPADGFHTYTTEWTADSLKWYIDGKLLWTRDKSTTAWYDKVFHKPYNIRLNFQVGGWLGNPDATTAFPADFVVDYVRVYQR